MSADIVVRVQGVSKKFCRSLSQSIRYGLVDIARDLLGTPVTFVNLRSNEFWALNDISFEVKRGQALALIGSNGAGKSTILRLLNGIFMPDRGEIEIRGRVGALIEVGAGFHPMLTGRENVYVNGAILGLSKKEIDKQFDSIVDFSGIAEFIDTPVKFYSSGMFVRLGFSVAAHLRPDVLLVDEILAVGDMAFQRKCLEHISQLCRNGCTVILVTHNEELARRACASGLLLVKGQVLADGDLSSCYAQYHKLPQEGFIGETQRVGNQKVEIQSVEFLDRADKAQTTFRTGEPVTIRIHLLPHEPVDDPVIDIGFNSNMGYVASSLHSKWSGQQLGRLRQSSIVEIHVPQINLSPGGYRITAAVMAPDLLEVYDWHRNSWDISIEHEYYTRGALWMPAEWRVLPSSPVQEVLKT